MYKLNDLIKMFSVPERTIRRHLKEGYLKGNKIGGTWRFDEGDINEYLGNKKIHNTHERAAFMNVIDYFNGFSSNEEEVCVMTSFNKKSISNSKKLSLFVSTLTPPFYFNIRESNKKQVVVFKGLINDAKLVLNKVSEINEIS